MNASKLTPIVDVLDRLWKMPSDRKTLASRSLDQLDEMDWLVLASWDAAATLGPSSGKLDYLGTEFSIQDDWGKSMLKCQLMASDLLVDEIVAVQYVDAAWVVVLRSEPATYPAVTNRSGASLIVALQLIRDHLDSIMLHPFELRQRGIVNLAKLAEISSDHFRRLAAWYGEIRHFINR